MKVTSAEFVKAAVGRGGWPKDGMAQVAFAGRSNVGKSSLINRLVNRKGLVKTSSTPGKTREINFFLVNKALYFVDLPGFGYARVPLEKKAGWGRMIEEYLTGSDELRLVVVLLDIRHAPSGLDLTMKRWLDEAGVPALYVATKADKISRGQRHGHIRQIADTLGVEAREIVAFSSESGEGKGELWDKIGSAL